jgi:hypothetical protein
LGRNLPDDEARELQEQADKLEETAAYLAMQEEISAAAETLEAHRTEFEQMMADPGTAMDRAYRLFSEERFASLRYTSHDLERAFEVVGYPSHVGDDLSEEDMETIFAATLHLAGDEEQRLRLTRRLLRALPEYVAAGRYCDAWLIQHSAFRLLEVSEESNPFMFVMFQLAYDEWLRQIEEEQNALLEELGVDRSAIGKASIEEAHELTQDLLRDPDKKARIEAFYAAHPAVHDQTETWLLQLEGEAEQLLDRDDAECILLSVEEVAPWLPVLVDRTGPMLRRAREAADADRQLDPDVEEAIADAFVATIKEMVPAIYTPERVDRLVDDLNDYRRRLSEAGEQKAARRVDGALLALQRDGSPADNRFLVVTCYASLRAIMQTAAENLAAAQEGAQSGDA